MILLLVHYHEVRTGLFSSEASWPFVLFKKEKPTFPFWTWHLLIHPGEPHSLLIWHRIGSRMSNSVLACTFPFLYIITCLYLSVVILHIWVTWIIYCSTAAPTSLGKKIYKLNTNTRSPKDIQICHILHKNKHKSQYFLSIEFGPIKNITFVFSNNIVQRLDVIFCEYFKDCLHPLLPLSIMLLTSGVLSNYYELLIHMASHSLFLQLIFVGHYSLILKSVLIIPYQVFKWCFFLTSYSFKLNSFFLNSSSRVTDLRC